MLEAHAVLWQGSVDLEQKLLMIPTWSCKQLVVLRDRRHNTGPSLFARGDFHNLMKKAQHLVREHLATPSISHRCPNCGKSNPVPDFVQEFRCNHCSAPLLVPTSMQLALYDVANGDTAATPAFVLQIPTEGVHVMDTPDAGGWFRKVLPGSDRQYGLSLCAQENGRETNLVLRFSTVDEREEVRRLLQIPLLRGRGLALAAEYASLLSSPPAIIEEELPMPSAPPADFPEAAPTPPVEPVDQAHRSPPAQQADQQASPDDGLCVVCLEHPADTAVVPCGHLCACHRCMGQVMAAERLCPMCRVEASSTMRIYRP